MFYQSKHKVRFFSLRWRIIVFVSLILLLANSAMAYFSFKQATLQYENELTGIRTVQARQIKALLKNGYTALSNVSTFIPLIGNLKINGISTKEFSEMLEQSGTLLDVEWGIQVLYLFSSDGELLLSWPDIGEHKHATPPEIDLQNMQVTEQMVCANDCLQFVSSPILKAGETTGYLLVGRSIDEPIITFNKLTQSEVVFLSSSKAGNSRETLSAPYLTSWGSSITAITHPDKTYKIIQQLENVVEAQNPEYGSYEIRVDNDWYDLNMISLEEGVDVLIVYNITDNKKQIAASALNSILIGIVGLILSEGLLIIMLRGPVKRLTNLAANLPLLVEGEYQSLKEKLQKDRKQGRWLVDEIDSTLDATTELTVRLESLQISREQAEMSLTWLADHDTLTELVNRRGFLTAFNQIINQAKRYQHQCALLFMDLDSFKEINDLSGHTVGDKLLRQVADSMHFLVRKTDLSARLGGDEFAIVMPEATASQAVELAGKISLAVSRLSISTDVFTHTASASIGIALFPDHGENVPELMANADMAMYHSKAQQPGSWHVFSVDEMAREKLNQKLVIKDLVSDALANNLFEFQYQPIIDVKTCTVVYFEALIRIRKKDGELIYPDSFISVAEQTGMIRKIDLWVIDHSIKLLLERPDISLSINLSSYALIDEQVVDSIASGIQCFGIDPSRLLIEVTESGVIDNVSTTVKIMNQIVALGCKFALDDFGTGFASYNHLRMLPVDIIKIDGCFIKNIDKSPQDKMLVKSIAEMGSSMNMRVVAEYVENEAVLQILDDIGIEYAQGFYIGKPAALKAE